MAKGANEPRPKEPQPKISHNLENSTYMILWFTIYLWMYFLIKYDPWAIMKKWIKMNETSLHREMLKTENYGLIIS